MCLTAFNKLKIAIFWQLSLNLNFQFVWQLSINLNFQSVWQQATSQMLRRPSHFTRAAHHDMSRPVLQVICHLIQRRAFNSNLLYQHWNYSTLWAFSPHQTWCHIWSWTKLFSAFHFFSGHLKKSGCLKALLTQKSQGRLTGSALESWVDRCLIGAFITSIL